MSFPMKVAVAGAVRTAVGRAIKGTLARTRPEDMLAAVMKAALSRVDGLAPADVDDVVVGCAMPEAEQGLNIARNAVFVAGWPDTIAGQTINRFCASGLQAIAHGAAAIHAGIQDAVLAAGVESMSAVPMGGNKTRLHPTLSETFPEAYIGMGHTAERVARKFAVSRQEQDAFALRSQRRALEALAAGHFADEVVLVQARQFVSGGGARFTAFDRDECPRSETSLEGLAALRPAFSAKGTVTAGNSSPLSDGAAAVMLLSEARTKALGVQVLGYFRAFAVAGVPPDIMGTGPIPAIGRLLRQTGLAVGDIDLFEINEAFAAQAVHCQRKLQIPDDKLNVSGGAIALGHPLGCTGAKLSTTLLHALRRQGGRYGVVSMCVGGGMGAAGLFEAA